MLAQEMDKLSFKIDSDASTTPKLYLDDEIWNGLESYQRKFMGKIIDEF